MINLQDLKPGDQFTRTYANPTRRPALCTVREVEFTPDRPDRVRVIYTRTEPNGLGHTGPFPLYLQKDGTTRGAYDTDRAVGAWSIDGWTPVTSPSDLSPGDVVRAETTPVNPVHGIRGPISGTVIRVYEENGDPRVLLSDPCATRSFRNWNWEKRSSHETEAPPQYPSIHHLRAAVFDIAMANRESGTWCSDVFAVLYELSIINRPACYLADVAKDQEQLIDQLVTQLREVSDANLDLGPSLDEAWTTLGIPRVPPPTAQRMTVEVEVPATWTPADVHATLNQQADIRVVEES